MANLLSSLYIEAQADLCDCQYSSSSGLCYASEPAKWKQLQSHTHTGDGGGGRRLGRGGIDSVILCAGKCKCRHGHELQTLDTCLEEATQTTTNNFAQTVLPLVCLLLCLLSFQVCPVSYGVSVSDCCRAKPQQSHGVQWSRFLCETSPSCIDTISPVQSNDIARFGDFSLRSLHVA